MFYSFRICLFILLFFPVFLIRSASADSEPTGCGDFVDDTGQGFRCYVGGPSNLDGNPTPVLLDEQLLASDSGINEFSLPGIWEYSSSVPNGKGFAVYGYEATYTNFLNNPITFEKQSNLGQITDPRGNKFVYLGFVKSVGDQLSPRLYFIGHAGGGNTQLGYDTRGNVNKTTVTGTDDVSTIVFEKDFDPSCDTLVSCNKPNWVKDGRGNQTSYVYDNTHGGVLKVTSPAGANGVTPQTRYEYAQFQARFKNVSGQVVASGKPIWLLTKEEYCISTNPSGNGCVGGASDEVVTTYDYGPTTGANNLALRGTTITADGVTKRTCFYYDDFGNKTAETQPKAGMTSCY